MKKMRAGMKKANAGTTLVETLAAFVVLAAILAIFYHIVDFSDRLRMQAVDSAHLNQMFMREIYKNDDKIDRSFVEVTTYTKSGEGADKACAFWLELDCERTDLEKNYNYSYDESKIMTEPPILKLDNLGATAYSCIDPIVDEEQLSRPAAVNFKYVEPAVTEP